MNAVGTDGTFQITDSSNVGVPGADFCSLGDNSGFYVDQPSFFGYASPATTSAVTYKGRMSRGGGSGTVFIQNAAVAGQLYALEIGA